MFYQVGTHLRNNRTGVFSKTMVQIPIFGDPSKFQPPTNPLVLNSTSLDDCSPSFISANYYKDTLYIFCQGVDNDGFAGMGGIILYNDNGGSNAELSKVYIDRFTGALPQPIEAKDINSGKPKRFSLMLKATDKSSMTGISLDPPTIGQAIATDYGTNITESYGTPISLPKNNTTDAIIGGSVVGGLVLLVLIIYLFVYRRRPQWQRWLKDKIAKEPTMSHAEENKHSHGSKVGPDENDENINKIEDSFIQDCSFDGRDKILVMDDDMPTNLTGNATAYMQDVPLERHPRPTFFTILKSDPDDQGCIIEDHSNGSSSARATSLQDIEKHNALNAA
ncbi:hypothetical protein BX616_006806 [Lobosporangium transversale]|nr:hypothetical protein BX616_006806 [Lobosporangium transversale]